MRAPDWTHSTSMNRAKTCARGRNSRVEAPFALTTSPRRSTVFSASAMKLSCVSSQPFGRPVVPEV